MSDTTTLRVAALYCAQAAAEEGIEGFRAPAGEPFDISRYEIESAGLQSLLKSRDCIDHKWRQTDASQIEFQLSGGDRRKLHSRPGEPPHDFRDLRSADRPWSAC